jgi:hypothetical protein
MPEEDSPRGDRPSPVWNCEGACRSFQSDEGEDGGDERSRYYIVKDENDNDAKNA